MKPTLAVVGPLPPPYHGVTISTSLVLENARLREFFDVQHVDTSDARSGENIGRWDWTNVVIATRALIRLSRVTRGEKGLVYLPLSQSTAGFIRDSLLVQIATRRGWKVAAHLRGSEFRSFYEASPWFFRRWMGATLRRITSIAVMGQSLRSIFEGIVPSGRTVVVPNGTPDPAVDGAVRDDT